MDKVDSIITMLDIIVDTQRKRHIAGGILLSMSLLFGGLAITIITIKKENENG